MFVANGCEMQKLKHHRHNLFYTLRLQNTRISNIEFTTLLLLTLLLINIMWSFMAAITLIYRHYYFEVVNIKILHKLICLILCINTNEKYFV